MSQEVLNAASNPALAAQLVKEALEGGHEEQFSEPIAVQDEIKIVTPPSDSVELLAGLYNSFTGELIFNAQIRELNGVDEEALSKITDIGRLLTTILQRGTVKVGEEPANQAILDRLLTGDRELLTIKIRVATFGAEVELEGNCPHCDSPEKFIVNLDKDVEFTTLDDPTNRQIVIKCKAGDVVAIYPNGEVQRKLIAANDKTTAELDSILLKECITEINGLPIINKEDIKKLGMQDRRTILSEIAAKNPGPNLSDIAKNCPSCGLEVPIPLTLADMFRI